MLLGEVHQSAEAWVKLAGINLPPKLAYRLLKYLKLVTAEHEIVEKQRVALIHEITSTMDGQEASIDKDTPEMAEYAMRWDAVASIESDIQLLAMDFREVVDAVDEKDESLSVQDLSMLEPFFATPEAPLEEAA